MAPIRRYLRITKYSVLEVRIYLDNPSQQQWILNPRDDVLPRIFQAIRPYVLPKLREENERAKGKSKRPKGVKDTVAQDDFEVSIFLTEVSTRHSLLTKQKQFSDKPKMKSNSSKLTGWLEKGTDVEPVTIREESDDEAGPSLADYPEVDAEAPEVGSKRKGKTTIVVNEDISDDEGFQTQGSPATKRRRKAEAEAEAESEAAAEEDDKKKLSMKTAYDGFSIYGRILCLVVKRKGVKARPSGIADGGGQMMLENWVCPQPTSMHSRLIFLAGIYASCTRASD